MLFMWFEGMHRSSRLDDTWMLPVVKDAFSLRLDKNHNTPCCSLVTRVQFWEVCALLGGT